MNSHDILIKFLVYAHKVGNAQNIHEISTKSWEKTKTKQTKPRICWAKSSFCSVIQWILGDNYRTPWWISLEHLGKMMVSDVFCVGKRTSENPDIPHPFSGFPHPFRPFWWNSTGSPVATPGPYKRAAAPPVGAAAPWAAATWGRWWRRRRRAPARPVRSPRRAGGPGRRGRGRGPPPCLGKNGKTAARTPNSRKSTQQFDIYSLCRLIPVYIDFGYCSWVWEYRNPRKGEWPINESMIKPCLEPPQALPWFCALPVCATCVLMRNVLQTTVRMQTRRSCCIWTPSGHD